MEGIKEKRCHLEFIEIKYQDVYTIWREEGREEGLIGAILKTLKKGYDKESILDIFECTEELYNKALLQAES